MLGKFSAVSFCPDCTQAWISESDPKSITIAYNTALLPWIIFGNISLRSYWVTQSKKESDTKRDCGDEGQMASTIVNTSYWTTQIIENALCR